MAIVVGVVVIGGIAAIVSIEGAPAWQDLVGTLTNPAIIACVLGGAVAPILIARQERLGRLRAIMLRHRRCPHCGYGLRGLPTDDDGLTTCPECASIWRIDEASCVDPGPVPASRPRGILALVALGVAALVAGLVMYFVIR